MSITDDITPEQKEVLPKEEMALTPEIPAEELIPQDPDVIGEHKGRKTRKTKKLGYSVEGKNGKKTNIDISNIGIEPLCHIALDVLKEHIQEDPSANNQIAMAGFEMMQRGLGIILGQKAQYDKEKMIQEMINRGEA